MDLYTLSQPQIEQDPSASIERTAFVAVSDQGRCAPIVAQPIPSRIRYFARTTTSSGTSDSCRPCIHWQRSLVMAIVLLVLESLIVM
jgi:hypothetical protein